MNIVYTVARLTSDIRAVPGMFAVYPINIGPTSVGSSGRLRSPIPEQREDDDDDKDSGTSTADGDVYRRPRTRLRGACIARARVRRPVCLFVVQRIQVYVQHTVVLTQTDVLRRF